MVMRMADDKVMEDQFQQLTFAIINAIKEGQKELSKDLKSWIKNGMEEPENDEKVADAGTPAADDDCVIVAKDALCSNGDVSIPENEGAAPSNNVDVTLCEIAIPVEFAVPATEEAITTDDDGHLKGYNDLLDADVPSLGPNNESPTLVDEESSMEANSEDGAEGSDDDDSSSTALESPVSGQNSEMGQKVWNGLCGLFAKLLQRRELCPGRLKKLLQCVIGTVT